MEHLALSDRDKRIAQVLLLLERAGGSSSRSSVVKMSNERSAMLANCSRQTLSATLKSLCAAHLITQAYGAIVLTDVEGLKAFAGRHGACCK